jgi:competence protein ComEC
VGNSHERTEELLEAQNPHPNLLRIGHHGSLASSSLEFLQAVAPQFAVVSAGYYNTFRDPRPEVVHHRFEERKVTTYRTDRAEAVSFYLDGTTISARRVPR